MFEILPEELKSLAVRAKVRYVSPPRANGFVC